jgi:hypothetical protein
MAGQVSGQVKFTPFSQTVKHIMDVNDTILKIAEIMSL